MTYPCLEDSIEEYQDEQDDVAMPSILESRPEEEVHHAHREQDHLHVCELEFLVLVHPSIGFEDIRVEGSCDKLGGQACFAERMNHEAQHENLDLPDGSDILEHLADINRFMGLAVVVLL